jgi:hypothetical protein
VVFEVKRQVNNGPILSVKYFQLLDGHLVQVHGQSTQKLHAFKNYKCASHDLFYGVDLYLAGEDSGYNQHHMRLHPFEARNASIMQQLWSE